MKYDNEINVFWAIVWAFVLLAAILGIFWKPAIYAVVLIAAVMFGMFLHDFIQVTRMK